MVAKRPDDVPNLRPLPSAWRYLAYAVIGGAATVLVLALIAAWSSGGAATALMMLALLAFAYLAIYGLVGLVASLVRTRD
jgi:hypothetical protein